MGNVINVDMTGFNIAKAPDALATIGIGSCVAVCLYDHAAKIGGLAHIMLPFNKTGDKALCGKYADRNIRITAEDIGCSLGRAVVFYTESGAVEVTVLTQPPKRVTLR